MKPHIIVLILVVAAFIPELIFVFKYFSQKANSVNLPKITLRFNFLILFIGLFLLFVAILYDVNYLNYKSPMKYSAWKNISWADFRAIKRPTQTLNGSKEFAFICSEMKFEQNDECLKVTTLFHPSRSYTFNKYIASEQLLTHELYHLHITEYWSRQFRKKISNLHDKNNLGKLYQLKEEIIYEKNTMQRMYDEETYHGYILGEQKRWQNKMDSCLNSLKEFSNPIIKI